MFEFTSRSDHTAVMRQQAKWFERYDGLYQVLWWIPAGHMPTADQAKKRLHMLTEHGHTQRR